MIAQTVEHLRVSLTQTPSPSLDQDRQLLDVSNRCTETADELLEELRKVKLHQGEAWHKNFKKAFRSIFKTTKLDGLGSKLDEYQKLLNTNILTRLNAQDILQSQNLASLSLEVRHLAAGLEQGHKTVAELLPTLSRSFEEHVERNFVIHEQKGAMNKQWEDFKQSLFFPEMFSRQIDIVEPHHETCHWIFGGPDEASDLSMSHWQEGSTFLEWLENGKDVYWLSGKPGSGKSTLMKYLSNRFHSSHQSGSSPAVTNWANGTDVLVVSFFFWAMGTPEQHNYAGFLRSLLYQIASANGDLIPTLMEKQNVSCGPLQAWTVARLEATFRHFLAHKPLSISLCFVVDGLDESSGEYQDNLLETIRLLAQTSRTRVCVSSRPEHIFQQGFANSPQLRLQELNLADISKTAHAELYPLMSRHFSKNELDCTAFISSIAFESRGIFLWACLAIKDLKVGVMNADSFSELSSRLDRMPKTIEGMYENMLTKLDQSYLSDAVTYFQLLMEDQKRIESEQVTLLHLKYATEPVHVASSCDTLAEPELAELNHACGRLETRILTRCGGLVEIERDRQFRIGRGLYIGETNFYQSLETNQEETNISRHLRRVTFIHKTVFEFLRNHHRLSDVPDGSVPASEAISCGRLGVMGLLPVMICPMDHPEQCTVRLLNFTSQIMAESPLMGCLELDEVPPRGNHEFWSSLIEHTSRLLHRLNTAMSLSCRPCPKSDFASHDKSPPSSASVEPAPFFVGGETLPFHDTAGFAAFFGCHTYITSQVKFHGADYSRRGYLSYCAILGMDYMTRSEFGPYSILWRMHHVARSLGLQKILLECLHFEGHFIAPLTAPPQQNASRTANIDLTWATVLRASMELMTRSLLVPSVIERGQTASDSLIARMLDDWNKLAAIFIEEGVDVNHLLYLQYANLAPLRGDDYWSLNITLQATPLSTIKHSFYPYLVEEDPVMQTTVNFLSAHGAVDDFSFWSIWSVTNRERTVLTDTQAKSLKSIRPWEWCETPIGFLYEQPTVSRPKDPNPFFETLLEELRQNPCKEKYNIRSRGSFLLPFSSPGPV